MKRLLATLLLLTAICLPAYPKCGVPTTKRHRSTVVQFQKLTGYPHGRPGYVADHIIALCKGGLDTVANLQWQDRVSAKAKDRIECDCKLDPKPVVPAKKK